MSKKSKTHKDELGKDYLKLPFEVFYSGPLSVTSYEFKSDIPVKRFKDVKVVHMEQGRSWGVTFKCSNNNGPELFCCLNDLHDEVAPEWLSFESEEDIRFNYGCDYAVKIADELISFVAEQVDSEDELEYCCAYSFLAYELESERPDYIVLDANDSRIMIDSEGYVLYKDCNRLESKKLFEPNALDEDEFSDYTTCELWEAKAEWVKLILEEQFPRDKKLRLAFDTE
jgi:hypothetical protein